MNEEGSARCLELPLQVSTMANRSVDASAPLGGGGQGRSGSRAPNGRCGSPRPGSRTRRTCSRAVANASSTAPLMNHAESLIIRILPPPRLRRCPDWYHTLEDVYHMLAVTFGSGFSPRSRNVREPASSWPPGSGVRRPSGMAGAPWQALRPSDACCADPARKRPVRSGIRAMGRGTPVARVPDRG
jgi:hypothetical protein